MFPADSGKSPGPVQEQGPHPCSTLLTGETGIILPTGTTSRTDTTGHAPRTDLAPAVLKIETGDPIRRNWDLPPAEEGIASSPPLPPMRNTLIISIDLRPPPKVSTHVHRTETRLRTHSASGEDHTRIHNPCPHPPFTPRPLLDGLPLLPRHWGPHPRTPQNVRIGQSASQASPDRRSPSLLDSQASTLSSTINPYLKPITIPGASPYGA